MGENSKTNFKDILPQADSEAIDVIILAGMPGARVSGNLSMSTNYLIKQSRWQCKSKIIMCNRIM